MSKKIVNIGQRPWITGVGVRKDYPIAELKPCPFCGTEITEISGSENVNGHPYWYIYCPACGANVRGSNDKSVALENWNRRVTNGCINQGLK